MQPLVAGYGRLRLIAIGLRDFQRQSFGAVVQTQQNVAFLDQLVGLQRGFHNLSGLCGHHG